MESQQAEKALTVRVEHGALEFDNRSFVWVLFRELQGQFESACGASEPESLVSLGHARNNITVSPTYAIKQRRTLGINVWQDASFK